MVWLNNESLEFGGRLVTPWPIENREKFVYYAEQAWEAGYTTSDNFTRWENVPRREWKVVGGEQGPGQQLRGEADIEEDW